MTDSLQKISEETYLILLQAKIDQRKEIGKAESFKEMIGKAVAKMYG